jgi:hypothetical protein
MTGKWVADSSVSFSSRFAPHSGLGFLTLSTTNFDIDVILTAPFDLFKSPMNITIPRNISTGGNYIILCT